MVKSPEKQQSSSAAAAAVSCLEVVRETSSSSCKYKGVRKRKWGKYVSEIRLPNCRERIWLGSYDTAEKAARAFDAALYCLRGGSAKFNFPQNPPEIENGRSMTPSEIQVAAARFAHDATTSVQADDLDSQSDSLSSSEAFQHAEAESPCQSISPPQGEIEITDIPLDNAFLDQFLHLGGDDNNNNNISDFGLFPGFDDFSADYMAPPLPSNDYFWHDNSEELSNTSSYLWNF